MQDSPTEREETALREQIRASEKRKAESEAVRDNNNEI